MTSENDATSQKSMILSPTDQRLASLKYKAGQQFVQRYEALQDNGYDESLRGAFGQNKVIVEIDSVELNAMGEVGYRLAFVTPPQEWRWFVTEEVLEEDFINLSNRDNARFYLMSEEEDA